MKSVEQLKKMKEQVLEQQKTAGGGLRARVTVAMGTCGIASGADDTLNAILSEVENRGISDVAVTQTGCVGMCEFEPVVQIQVGENAPVFYGKIFSERVPALIEKHILQGETVTEWLVK